MIAVVIVAGSVASMASDSLSEVLIAQTGSVPVLARVIVYDCSAPGIVPGNDHCGSPSIVAVRLIPGVVIVSDVVLSDRSFSPLVSATRVAVGISYPMGMLSSLMGSLASA